MRTLILLCVVAIVVACCVAYFVGFVAVATDHLDSKYVLSFTINTALLNHHPSTGDTTASPGTDTPTESLAATGKIAAVRPEKNEIVVSENIKNWTFELAKDGKVFINDRESRLADLHAGDAAVVTYDRQGSQLIAGVIRSTRPR